MKPGPLVAVALVAALGCGPVEYIGQVGNRAANALALAQRRGAERYAPYEYTAAAELLRKAREEGSYASYQLAIEYGRRAQTLAEKAESLARQRASSVGPDGTR